MLWKKHIGLARKAQTSQKRPTAIISKSNQTIYQFINFTSRCTQVLECDKYTSQHKPQVQGTRKTIVNYKMLAICLDFYFMKRLSVIDHIAIKSTIHDSSQP